VRPARLDDELARHVQRRGEPDVCAREERLIAQEVANETAAAAVYRRTCPAFLANRQCTYGRRRRRRRWFSTEKVLLE